ncbi:MAG: tripartite tricarboxylate transporter TctB family protein [Geminicoccaceae bacterium]|nr:tripartite tricarboxylate transporter TctB family protein [Geminicoccaceae bacterium]MDW8124822.1 tripartite tricarboxylate transporter TctB family protein [Geminicoccaceae bacterium]
MRIHDGVFGVLLLLLAGFVLREATGFPPMPGQRFGPSLFPSLLAAGFALCGLLLLAGGLVSERGRPLASLEGWAEKGARVVDVALVVGGLVLLIALWQRLGFVIGATLFATALAGRFLGGRYLPALLVCAPACFAIDWAFRRLLLVPLPQGPLTGLYW